MTDGCLDVYQNEDDQNEIALIRDLCMEKIKASNLLLVYSAIRGDKLSCI